MAANKYLKVENFTAAQEREFRKDGKHVRNYGRLKKGAIQELATLNLKEGDRTVLLKRDRPWRLNRFIRDMVQSDSVKYGEASCRGHTIRVMDGGIASVLGKGANEGLDDDARDIEAQLDFAPWDSTDMFWRDFELWRELIGTSLINVLPDRAFALYIFAKDAIGDDAPIFYMELEIHGLTDRHTMIWELDQVLTTVNRAARPHEGSRASEYVSAYQKVYFFLNWDQLAPRRVDRIVISDLPKPETRVWSQWLQDQHDNKWSDAVIAILIIVGSCAISIVEGDRSISLVAGIIVAGIAAEEWIAPQSILFGAISRFYAHESLHLHMSYRMGMSMSTKRVLISLFASIGEVAELIADELKIPALNDQIDGPSLVLLIGSTINVACLVQTAYAGIYGGFSHSDFPSRPFYFPRIYVPRSGYVRQLVDDLKPVEEYCSVYRPLLHWQRGVANRFLGNEIDLTSPGAPPSMVCYWMTTPASSAITIDRIYGEGFNPLLLPFCVVEQLFALVGGLLVILLDVPVTTFLAFNLLLKRTHLFDRAIIRWLNTLALALYSPCQLLNWVTDAYNGAVAAALGLDTLYCRGRSTARLYRRPLIQKVRTGRSSNHPFKFGDYLYDDCYFRCSDQVIVNPRYSKLGMIEKGKLFYHRHKLLWTTQDGVRYENPCLSCGDNTVSRRSSFENRTKRTKVNPMAAKMTAHDTDDTFGFPLPRDVIDSRGSVVEGKVDHSALASLASSFAE